MNKAVVTTIRPDSQSRSNNPLRCKVFVKLTDDFEDPISKFYNDKIWKLKFKSKAWAWLTKQRSKLVIDALQRDVFGSDGAAKIQFNAKAGCSCGCSPGFIVDLTDKVAAQYRRANVWVNIDIDKPELNAKVLINLADAKLVNELQSHE
jgi:hypothetical protein